MTYGTGIRTAASTAAAIPATAISRVSWRRVAGTTLGTAHPFAGPVAEPLALPDGHLVLEPVDQGPARLERLPAVRAGHGDHDGEVPDFQFPRAVHRGQRVHLEVGGDLFGYPAQFRGRRRVRAVGQTGHTAAVVGVADCTGEQGDAARGGITDGGPQ